MLIILGTISTAPSQVKDLLTDLRAGIARTLKEDGCLFYEFSMLDEATGTILAAERWRDQDSLTAHLSTPEIAELLGKWGDKISLNVSKFDASNQRGMGD